MIEERKIQNKKMLLYSADRAINEVYKLQEGKATNEEVYFTVGTAIHWLVDCIERLPDEMQYGEYERKFSGLKFANNCLKHNPIFEKASEEIGHKYPIRYPINYGLNYIWGSLDAVKPSSDRRDYFGAYNDEWKGKYIDYSLSETLGIINRYYNDL